MESSVEELGDLKYSIALEIPLQEIKPTYDAVYKELKKTRLNGFRPGKYPKGWLDKRFKSAMQQEAVDRVIPTFMESALENHSLKPVTVPVIQQIDFDRKSPLSATLHFEIGPKLPQLDYGKILLTRKEVEEVKADEIGHEMELLMQGEEYLEPKSGSDIKVENDDWVLIDYSGTIEGKEFTGSIAKELQFKIDGTEYKEFHAALIGMGSGEEKEAVIELSERFDENEGKKADFRIKLTGISTAKRPEMDEGFFKKFGVANEKEIKEKIAENIESRKKAELQSEYRMQVGSQLTGLYDDFVLPEELVKLGKERVDTELEEASAKKDITEAEIEKQRQEGYENARMDLRMKFILDSIREHENLKFDEKEAAGEFFNLAQITGQNPDELIQTPFGRNMY
ncbi:MAG: trigger factor, partial [SAR324 cluster bacterium]|nr:trigger factor [SAR324 cluster bacterium]